MSLELSGSFITDIFILLGVLFLPLPSAPYILYLFTTNSIYEAGLVFFLATTSRDFISYYIGYFSKKLKLINYLKAINFFKNDFVKNNSERISKITEFSKEKLNKATVREVIVARWIGIHPIIVALGLGRLSSKYILFFLPNTFYVIIDLIFYWILLGTGKFVFEYFFPGVNIENIFSSQYLYLISIVIILLFYIFYAYYKWR